MTDTQLGCLNSESLGLLSGIKYNINELEHIVQKCGIKLRTILRTQNLTPEFCKNYLLNEEYQILDGDDLSINDIVRYQKHISIEDLIN